MDGCLGGILFIECLIRLIAPNGVYIVWLLGRSRLRHVESPLIRRYSAAVRRTQRCLYCMVTGQVAVETCRITTNSLLQCCPTHPTVFILYGHWAGRG